MVCSTDSLTFSAEAVPDREATIYLGDGAKVHIRKMDRYQIDSGYPGLWPSKDIEWIYAAAVVFKGRFSDPIVGTSKEELTEKIGEALGKLRASA